MLIFNKRIASGLVWLDSSVKILGIPILVILPFLLFSTFAISISLWGVGVSSLVLLFYTWGLTVISIYCLLITNECSKIPLYEILLFSCFSLFNKRYYIYLFFYRMLALLKYLVNILPSSSNPSIGRGSKSGTSGAGPSGGGPSSGDLSNTDFTGRAVSSNRDSKRHHTVTDRTGYTYKDSLSEREKKALFKKIN